jgi:diaminopimelate epimerase
VQLTKHHGLGNDFLVALVDTVPSDGADLARSWCHRTHGIGADGLIFGTNVPGQADGPIDVTFTLFNSDGSQAEISGNGMRCFAHAIARHLSKDTLTLTADTAAGRRRVEVSLDRSGVSAVASVEMGVMAPLALTKERVGQLDKTFADLSVLRWDTGDMGNPHIVLEVADPLAVDLATVGPMIEAEFGGINVHFVAPRPDGIEMRVWERGAGITEACGSGACAVGAIGVGWGIGANPVTVHMPGGKAEIAIAESGITLTGPSAFIASIDTEAHRG